MNNSKANQFYEDALKYASEHHEEELKWARSVTPQTLEAMEVSEFLEQYCWVVYAAGFKESILRGKFDGLKKAFCNFDPVALAKMKSAEPAYAVINHRGKGEA